MQSGSFLRNRYRIGDTLGKGGMGAVYLANDETLGVSVAVKENLFADEEYATQFRREATILAKLRQSNLPRVTDHFVIQGQGQYLVMDFIEGEDLKQRLERTGALSEEEVVTIGAAICDALSYLHSLDPPVLHRDIKPGNVKITSGGQIYLVDFGLAKVMQGTERTATGAQGLTPGYSPPEQYGSAPTDARSDIFSLGATLFAALTGSAPTDSMARMMDHDQLINIRDINSRVSKELSNAIAKALEIDAQKRYQTADEFKQALLGAQPQVAGDKPAFPRPRKSRREQSAGSSEATMPAADVEEKPKRASVFWQVIVVFLLVGGLATYLFFPDALPGLIGTEDGSATQPPEITSGPDVTQSAAFTEIDDSQTPVLSTEPAGGASPAPAGTPVGGGGGQILFASDRSGLPQIYLLDVDVDGDEPAQLTNEPGGACQPDWSPDGAQFVYVSPCDRQRDIYENSRLFIRNADGTGRVALPAVPGGDFDPDWSPDGGRIVFTSIRGTGRRQIWIVNLADNSVENFLNSVSSHDFMPGWSPDGELIVFVSTRLGATQIFYAEVGVEDLGTDFTNLDTSVAVANPVWSPDGSTILFTQTGASGGIPQLVTMSWEERGPKVDISPNSTTSVREGQYSPDGNWIVFESNPGSPNRDIFIMAAGGGEIERLTTDAGVDFDPVWRP